MTKINWFTGTTMTTAEIYDAYGFNTMTPCGLTIQDVVWQVITRGHFNPCINGVPVWNLPLTLADVEQAPAPAVDSPLLRRAPAVEKTPAPAVEKAPAPAVETLLTRRVLDEETELISTIKRACYMHGASTRGLACYDEYVDEMTASWSIVLDEAAGALALYIEQTDFKRFRSDAAALRSLQDVLAKATSKLNKHRTA